MSSTDIVARVDVGLAGFGMVVAANRGLHLLSIACGLFGCWVIWRIAKHCEE